jgi:hypothetical protein
LLHSCITITRNCVLLRSYYLLFKSVFLSNPSGLVDTGQLVHTTSTTRTETLQRETVIGLWITCLSRLWKPVVSICILHVQLSPSSRFTALPIIPQYSDLHERCRRVYIFRSIIYSSGSREPEIRRAFAESSIRTWSPSICFLLRPIAIYDRLEV